MDRPLAILSFSFLAFSVFAQDNSQGPLVTNTFSYDVDLEYSVESSTIGAGVAAGNIVPWNYNLEELTELGLLEDFEGIQDGVIESQDTLEANEGFPVPFLFNDNELPNIDLKFVDYFYLSGPLSSPGNLSRMDRGVSSYSGVVGVDGSVGGLNINLTNSYPFLNVASPLLDIGTHGSGVGAGVANTVDFSTPQVFGLKESEWRRTFSELQDYTLSCADFGLDFSFENWDDSPLVDALDSIWSNIKLGLNRGLAKLTNLGEKIRVSVIFVLGVFMLYRLYKWIAFNAGAIGDAISTALGSPPQLKE